MVLNFLCCAMLRASLRRKEFRLFVPLYGTTSQPLLACARVGLSAKVVP